MKLNSLVFPIIEHSGILQLCSHNCITPNGTICMIFLLGKTLLLRIILKLLRRILSKLPSYSAFGDHKTEIQNWDKLKLKLIKWLFIKYFTGFRVISFKISNIFKTILSKHLQFKSNSHTNSKFLIIQFSIQSVSQKFQF